MQKNDIGGFFVSLGLNIDKNSWETGNRIVDGMGNTFNKLIGTARNAAVVLAGTAIATGSIESAAYKTSVVLGVATEKLDLWKTAAKIAGVSADGVVGAMSRIADVQNRLKWDDSGIEAFSKKLGKLKIGYEEIKDLGADEALGYILSKAQSLEGGDMTTAEIATAVGDIVGTGGRDLYIELGGQDVKEFLAGASKIQFTNSQTNKESREFMEQVRILKTTGENLSKLLGSEIGIELTGYVKSINDWIGEHGQEIADGIGTVAQNVGKLVEKLVGAGKAAWPTVKKVGAAAGSSIVGTAEGVIHAGQAIVEGDAGAFVEAVKETADAAIGTPTKAVVKAIQESDWAAGQHSKNEAEAAIRKYKKEKGYDFFSIPYDELTPELQADFDKYAEKSWGHFRFAGAVKDGIMRPDGTVTQVAPDDWVFAARSLGDLARAFVPQNHTAVSAGEYTINQTFNINGGSDMPQVLRQQAYRGTQEGLLEIMQQSSQRLQLMSGTR